MFYIRYNFFILLQIFIIIFTIFCWFCTKHFFRYHICINAKFRNYNSQYNTLALPIITKEKFP